MSPKIKLIECPRDAMQGIHDFIPTEKKIEYLNLLLKCGFDTLDFGSFVSPKAIPQLADTVEVLKSLDLKSTRTKLLAIIANVRGAQEACQHKEIAYLGFPFSVSEEFQKRNTNSTIAQSLERVKEIQKLCLDHQKKLVIYISMGFGNPYNEPWNAEVVIHWVQQLNDLGIEIISLADTVGVSTPENIQYLFTHLIPAFRNIEFGAHLHSMPQEWEEKIKATINSGCLRIDSAVNGIGGCPMAGNNLVGNIPTENILDFAKANNMETEIDLHHFGMAMAKASEIF